MTAVARVSRRHHYRLIDLTYGQEQLLADIPIAECPAPNPMPDQEAVDAGRYEIVLNGGMRGHMVMAEAGGRMGGSDGMTG